MNVLLGIAGGSHSNKWMTAMNSVRCPHTKSTRVLWKNFLSRWNDLSLRSNNGASTNAFWL